MTIPAALFETFMNVLTSTVTSWCARREDCEEVEEAPANLPLSETGFLETHMIEPRPFRLWRSRFQSLVASKRTTAWQLQRETATHFFSQLKKTGLKHGPKGVLRAG